MANAPMPKTVVTVSPRTRIIRLDVRGLLILATVRTDVEWMGVVPLYVLRILTIVLIAWEALALMLLDNTAGHHHLEKMASV
jgi:hypothetical protein